MATAIGAAAALGDRVIADIESNYPGVRRDGNDTVSGKVAGEFRTMALYALLAAMVAISIYIWVRFEWQFGVGALFALFHDVSLTMGLFALFQLEFSLQIIAAKCPVHRTLEGEVMFEDRVTVKSDADGPCAKSARKRRGILART